MRDQVPQRLTVSPDGAGKDVVAAAGCEAYPGLSVGQERGWAPREAAAGCRGSFSPSGQNQPLRRKYSTMAPAVAAISPSAKG